MPWGENMKPTQTLKPIITGALSTMLALSIACGYSSKMTAPVAGTLPAITDLTPTGATAGGAAFTLTVNGSNFGSKAVVNWNGAAQTASTTFVNANQVMVAVPASAIATSGTVTVTVTNPGTSGTGIYGMGTTLPETSTGMNFTIN
jgi:hypothetical protein